MKQEIIEYGVTDAALEGLRNKYSIVPDLSNKEGYEFVRLGLSEVRQLRINVDKKRKELKADSIAWGKKVEAEAKKITSVLLGIEEPLKTLKLKFDEKKKVELEARRKAEEERRLSIMRKIDEIKNIAIKAQVEDSSTLSETINNLESLEIGQDYYEFQLEAEEIKRNALTAIYSLHDEAKLKEAKEVEAEQERMEAEKKRKEEEIRLAEERRLLEESKRIEQEKLDLEKAKLAEEKRKMNEEREKAKADRLAIQAELDKVRLEKEEVEEKAANAKRRAEEEKLGAEKAEIRRQQEIIEKAKQEKEKADQKEAERLKKEEELKQNTELREAKKSDTFKALNVIVDNEKISSALIEAITNNNIPNVTFNYIKVDDDQ